jgi:hypothetical protein
VFKFSDTYSKVVANFLKYYICPFTYECLLANWRRKFDLAYSSCGNARL